MNRRRLLSWLGLAPAVVALRGVDARPDSSGELILAQFGVYQCGGCMQALRFEEIDLKKHPKYAIGVCPAWSKEYCKHFGTRYRVPLTYMRVETETA